MLKPALSMRLEPTYLDVIDKLPGKDRKEKILGALNFALLKGYAGEELGHKAADKPVVADHTPQIKTLEEQVKTLQSAFALLNHDYMALKNLLGY